MDPPIARTAWAWLALLIALTLSCALCTYCLDGLVNPVKASLHLSDGRMSFLLGWAYVGAFAAASLPGGWINDHAPRRRMLTLGAALWGLGAVCCALAHGFPQFCAGRMLVGLGQATLAPASFSILADSFPTRLRARVFGAALAAGGVGPGVGLTATGVLLSLATHAGIGADWSWRLAILACATPAFILVLVLFAMPEPPRTAHAVAEAGAPPSDRRFWLPLIVTLLAIAAVTLSDGAQLSWSAAALVREHALTVADAAKAAGLVFIFCGAAGPLLAGALADLLYRRHGVAGRLMVGLAAVSLLIPLQCFFQASSTPGLLAVLVGAGLTVVTGEVIGAAVLQDFAPANRRGLAASANSLFGSMAIGLGATGVAVFSKLRPSASHPVTHAMTLTTVPASVLALVVFLALWFVVRRSGDMKAGLRMAVETT
jgi:MFS family permease